MPEALILEEITKRYRVALKTHISAVDHVRLTHLKWIYEVNDKYDSHATKTDQTMMNAWRIIRMVNPVSGVNNEVRGKILSHLFEDLSENLQTNIKRSFCH